MSYIDLGHLGDVPTSAKRLGVDGADGKDGVRPSVDRAWSFVAELRKDFPRGTDPDSIVSIRRWELKWLRDLPKMILGAIFVVNEKLESKIAVLEKQLAEVEARESKSLADAFRGPWLPQTDYLRGALVQHAGALWLCLADTRGKPGQDAGWRMVIRA